MKVLVMKHDSRVEFKGRREMTIFSGDTQKRCVQLLTSCAAMSLIICGLAGCRAQSNPTRNIAADTIPDKESYLLSKLKTRYQDPETHCGLGPLTAA